MGTVFERFSDRARRVVVLAQEEARLLNHDYIGTEHLLLGLVHEGEGVGAESLSSLGLSLEAVRAEVEEVIGQRAAPSAAEHIPFTPRAKKVLELSLRESLQLGHDYIGTEHLLLGLIREEHGVAAQVLVKLGADLRTVRERVLTVLRAPGGAREAVPTAREADPSLAGMVAPDRPIEPGPRCPYCRAPLDGNLTTVPLQAGERPVVVVACGACSTSLGLLSP